MDNLSSSYTNISSRGLITDLDPSSVSKDFYTYARNSLLNTHQGNLQFLTNEPSNRLCVNLPYTLIGFVKLIGGQYALFLTDNLNSEIGIFDSNFCTYTKVVNDSCLNFNTSNIVKASSKENFDCTQTIYWTDGVNPRRRMDLSNVPYLFSTKDDACNTKVFTNRLDCNEILMTPKLTVPTIKVSLGSGGELGNGTYQLGMAYTINQQRVTDYYAITSPQSIWSHLNLGQSLNVEIDNLDREFNEYQLIIIYTQQNVSTAKTIGYFSTSTNTHQIVNINRPEYITIPFSEVLTLRPKYYKADDVVNNDQFLIWSGVSTRPELNYQKQAMNIEPKWVLYQVPVDYYINGGSKVGYCRGERYAFGIQWLFDTGEWSNAYHIPGRTSSGADKSQATGADVYEVIDPSCGLIDTVKTFQVYDTSKKGAVLNNTATCNESALYEGEMGYWESSETYPDNTIMFGDQACTPIRHPQFPNECMAPRYQPGGQFINLLGVKFENIEHPKDSSGNFIANIVGYRIVRGNRDGNRSVVAKGMFSNVRSYKESIDQAGDNQEILYPNYPYNDLREDNFISSTQTYYSGGERRNTPLIDFKKDQFNFYSPATLFSNVSLGEEVIFETEEISNVSGFFENVFNHPRDRVLSNSVFWLAVLVGAIDGVLSVFGKRCVTQIKDGTVNIASVGPPPSDITVSAIGMQFLQECEGLVSGLKFSQILQLPAAEAVAKTALKILQTAAKAGMGAYFAFNTANQIIADILSFMTYRRYALQYDSHGQFNNFKCIQNDNKRRQLSYYQYLYDGINTVQNVKFNNFKRESSVYLHLNNEVATPTTIDNSRKTLSDAQQCNTPFSTFNTTASMYYGMIKRKVPNQYGQIDSVIYLDTGFVEMNLTNQAVVGTGDVFYTSDIVFGGDMFINRFAFNRHHQFFRQNIANANFPDGTEYDYSLYRNVGYPRFWLNSERYDMSEVIVVGSSPNKLPSNKYNLDCFSSSSSLTNLNLSSQGGYFYLYNNGVVDFFVESEYNLDFRDYKSQFQNFYSKTQTSLTDIFRSDRIDTPEEFVYDKSFSKQLVENSIVQQRIDYNPIIDQTCFSSYPNRVIYSLPASLDQKSDNWLIYLTNNFYDFPLSDFGALTGAYAVDNQQVMFTFDRSAPYITIGRDELQTNGGVKVVIGDGGLFSREPRPLAYTDYWYGNSQNHLAFVNTQFGSFYTSARQGRIFNWHGQLEEISRQGMHWWFKNYLPSKLLEDFPNFRDNDNPVVGVSLISGFDNTDEKYYLSKRDFALKDIYRGKLMYDRTKNVFLFLGTTIKLGDPIYFDDASWTISYSPKDQAFISWHDWQPDWIIQGEQHFFTVKYDAIWAHNERCDSFCNFYDINYPWEIEYLINNGGQNQILRNIEYVLEAGKYFGDCSYYHQILDDNFDQLVIYNLEQSSGYLKPVLRKRNNITDILNYPQLTVDGWQVAYSKVEQKTRIDQFFDLTKDRGEYTKNNYPLWTISPNGYIRTVTPEAINVNKNSFERKKFRNLWHKIYLSKSVSNDKKYLFKFATNNETISPR